MSHPTARFLHKQITDAHPKTRQRATARRLKVHTAPRAHEAAPDLDEAVRFLAALAPGESQFTFQTFDDAQPATGTKRAPRGALVSVLHGKLAEHGATLARLNAQGAGVFVTVNATDGKGRATGNITRVRAIFVDLDFATWHKATERERTTMPAPSLDQVRAGKLAPHLIVQTSLPTKWHCYWLVDGVALDQFTAIQKTVIARFAGSDASISDLPRIMRLPGFVHRKGAAMLTRLLEVNAAPPYTAEQITAEFPPAPTLAPAPVAYSSEKDAWVIPALQKLGLYVDPQGEGKHGMRCPWEDGDHTDSATVYFEPGARGTGTPGFKCFACEAGGHKRSLRDLKAWLHAETDGGALTDAGNLTRFLALHGKDILYCKLLDAKGKGWFIWDGLIWRVDESNKIRALALKAAQAFRASIPDEIEEARRKASFKWTKRTESAEGIAAVVSMAQAAQIIATVPGRFDADPFALTVQNGTLDLRTGALREVQRDNLITKAAPLALDPAATCPQWLGHLERIFVGNAELIAFMQRVYGYALTGDAGEEVMFILHGGGKNGKSVCTEVLTGLLGLESSNGHVATLGASALEPRKDPGAIRNDIAKCHAARVVLVNEPKLSMALDEGAIKVYTTPNSPVEARFLFAEFFTFLPKFKLFVSTNHKPKVTGVDDGIWRRLCYIPFTVQISEAERIKNFSQRLLATEAAGILNWALAGCRDWLANGLRPPEIVTSSTAEWRETADWFGQFITETLARVAEGFVATRNLYGVFQIWCRDHGRQYVPAEGSFVEMMKERGYAHAQQQHEGTRERGFVGVEFIKQTPGSASGLATAPDSDFDGMF